MRPASEAEKARLGETFAALCRIPSPFGHEAACAEAVRAELENMGLHVIQDDTAAVSGGECGNLLARLPSRRSDRTVLLCAHLDTVEPAAPIEPAIVDGAWVNEHEGILGADNKASIAVILEVARRASVEGSPVGLELLFTVSEENALAGAKALDASVLTADFGYVFDHATPIGEVVVASPTYYRIGAEFRGRAAHAGIRPEDGRSAILAAAHAIAHMPHGRLDPQTTANVGYIHSGVPSATNVVPEHCSLLAETRSLDAERVEQVVVAMVDAIQDASAGLECDVDLVVEKLFAGYRTRGTAPAVVAAEAALRTCGYEPERITTGGGSDANVFIAGGLEVVNLANGTERNHQPDERVYVGALEGMFDVALALLDECAAFDAAPPPVTFEA